VKRIGLLGGTFDPPHIGHLLLAQEAIHCADLDEVWFVPVGIPPHKEREEIASNDDRLAMIKRAIKGKETLFNICTIELEREGKSYTIDTVRTLTKKHPDVRFFFIIGGDMVKSLPTWKGIDELLATVTFIGFKRPGVLLDSPYQDQLMLVEGPEVNVSSTMIRERMTEGKPISYLLPLDVERYIYEKGLYKTNESRKSPSVSKTSSN
jgi:nicotinate-nucleotide adenylyltransferase